MPVWGGYSRRLGFNFSRPRRVKQNLSFVISPSTTTFASGGRTGGCGKPTTGSGRRCANRKARIAIPAGRSWTAKLLRTTGVGGPDRGYDGAKRLAGRKPSPLGGHRRPPRARRARPLLSPLLARPRRRARAPERRAAGGTAPRLAVVWADAAYTGRFREWVSRERGWRVEVPRHPDRQSCGGTALRRSLGDSGCWRAAGGW
jgi:hypothetical protein